MSANIMIDWKNALFMLVPVILFFLLLWLRHLWLTKFGEVLKERIGMIATVVLGIPAALAVIVFLIEMLAILVIEVWTFFWPY